MSKKKGLPSKAKRIRELSRERIGAVPPARAIEERTLRSKPKHKKPIAADSEASEAPRCLHRLPR